MKILAGLFLVFGLLACNPSENKTKHLQNRIDSLEVKLANAYKPGFGEFMSNIQTHHIKLWFAGENENWELANFEIHEIMETFEDIEKYETDRPERKLIGMINPALDSVNNAIEAKDAEQFKKSFSSLTVTCNQCHQAADFGFNVVKIPDKQPFSNQEFKIQQ